MALVLAIGGVLWAAVLAVLLARGGKPAPARDPLGRLWYRFQRVLQRRGVAIAAHDGPDAIRRRAQRQLPEAAGDIATFAGEYARLRYGGGNPADARALRAMQARLSAIARATAARRRRRTAAAAPG
jgi:hypothetical protein